MLCAQLNAIGKGLTDHDKVYSLLNALDSPDYESFILTMLKPPLPSYTKLILLLQDHERRRVRKLAQMTSSMVFLGQKQSGSSSSYRPNSDLTRFSPKSRMQSSDSGILGATPQSSSGFHSTSRGFLQSVKPASEFSSSCTVSLPTCQICGKRGHDALKCWHCFDNSYQASTIHTFLSPTTQALASIYSLEPISLNGM